MEEGAKGRAWFGLTAFAVLFGLIVQVLVAANATGGAFDTTAGRVFNVFCFFTIQSNVIVGVTSLLLALNPRRSSTAFKAFRLSGIVSITITGIVYHTVLRGLFDLERWALVADNVLHTIVPVIAVVGWLVWGPRGLTSARIMRLSVIFPICWLIFTLIRGAIVDFYPYHFIDVNELGYARVLVNCVWVAILYLGVAAGATALDRWLFRIGSALTAAEKADRRR
ncbi:MAG: Pr6Pr family membrane protein [Actinobacteria bacterium]|nr:Pr6Pr family membrane protein [Actinomycetota bacterium]